MFLMHIRTPIFQAAGHKNSKVCKYTYIFSVLVTFQYKKSRLSLYSA